MGPIPVNSKSSRTFIIRNMNEILDFNFAIYSLNSDGTPNMNVTRPSKATSKASATKASKASAVKASKASVAASPSRKSRNM